MTDVTINYTQPRFGVAHATLAPDSAQSGGLERRLAIR